MFLPREVIEARIAQSDAEVARLRRLAENDPTIKGWPLQLAESGEAAARGDLAKLDMIERLAGALDECLLQIAQMKGLFDDEDGAIAAADEEGHDALTGWMETKAKDRTDYYGKGAA